MLRDKRVIVLGLGRSGIAAARWCLAQGAHVLGTDIQPLAKLPQELLDVPLELVTGGHRGVDFTRADLVVVSPGVPRLPQLLEAEQAGVEVIGELELGCRYCRAPLVCVGGTNGKSTTTVLIGEMLAAAKQRAFVGGNLGTPLTEVVDRNWDVVVLEVSSFQLERAPSFHPRVSVLLNITEDHLDRYDGFGDYALAKGNAFVRQTSNDVAIVPYGDSECYRQAQRGQGRLVSFGRGGDFDLQGPEVVERATGLVFSLREAELDGHQNLSNAAAAIAAARSLELGQAAIEEGLRNFQPLPHRMRRVMAVAGVNFYDDSKATNVGAAVVSLLGLSEPRGVLIAGGRDKLGSYEPLVAALGRKGRALVLIGEASARIAQAVQDRVPVEHAVSLEHAVAVAFRLAHPGDAVLLAPACSSFDMFQGYAERGDRFIAAVGTLRQATAEESDP